MGGVGSGCESKRLADEAVAALEPTAFFEPLRELDSQAKGSLAEHLVCADFLRRGMPAACDVRSGAPYDVQVDLPIGPMLVQVKATSGMQPRHKPRPSGTYTRLAYSFRVKSGSGGKDYRYWGVDAFAFVCLDLGQILYRHEGDIGSVRNNIRIGRMTVAKEAPGSLERLVEKIQSERIFR